MKHCLYAPPFGTFGDVHLLVDLAGEAEQAGWDGFYLWDHVLFEQDVPFVDAWIALTAMACATDRIRLGPLITPLARRRPWKVAQESVTLDHLSAGRFVLPVGLGWVPDPWFRDVGEPLEARVRADRLDEALAIIDGLWRGEAVSHEGAHFCVDGLRLRPRPFPQPRIPVWVVGGWRSERSLARAARWDGVIPQRIKSEKPLEADELRELVAIVRSQRVDEPFDVVVENLTPEHDPSASAAYTRELAAAGATWFLEAAWMYMYETPGRPDAIRRRLRQGPPR